MISLGKFAGSLADQAVQNGVYTAPWDEDSGEERQTRIYIWKALELYNAKIIPSRQN